MSFTRYAKFALICAPLALGACAEDKTAENAAQLAAANQKADQALTTAEQALQQAKAANEKADREYQRGLRK
jgi:outer membrane lipoprotein-sorting protein